MHHPSIVEFYRAFAFEDHTYVVLELCPNGSLMDMVRNRRSLSLPEVRRYMIQLCGGVKYMHQRCVIHRDLKMGNIFIDAHMNIKIGDFGLAAVVVDDKERRQTMCGTPNYIAPELLTKTSAESGHGKKVDTWAIGIICYAMLIGTPPFASKSQTEIYAKLKQLQYEWKEDCQYFVPNQAKDLVTLCLNLVPAERPGMDDLVEHEFFKMGTIADELDRSCLRGVPRWLEHADPRGDKVTAGYGVDHVAICRASGVGKTLNGHVRPSVGGNVDTSAMAEVALENAKGCAPVIPMPEGVIYKEFVAAKEDWATNRKRPITSSKVRGRKEQTSTSATSEINPLSNSLPETRSSSSASTSIVPGLTSVGQYLTLQRAPVQSFAAQQRQQALPSRALNPRVISSQMNGKAFSLEGEKAQPAQESPKKHSFEEKDDAKTQKVGRSSQPSRGFLLEQPMRAISRITRSSSSRDPAPNPTEQVLKPAKVLVRKDVVVPQSGQEKQPIQARPARAKTTSRAVPKARSDGRHPSGEVGPDQNNSSRVPPSSSARGSAGIPLHMIDANDRQLRSALFPKADMPKAVLSSSCTHAKREVIAPTDVSTPITGSASGDILSSLRGVYRDLSQKVAVETNNSTASRTTSSNAHTVVEKWVDYSERYGVGYILSDGSAGIALRSSADNTKHSSFAVIRNSREHYPKRVREEEVQIVPQGLRALPVEFYEGSDGDGIRKMKVSARTFRYDQSRPEQWVDGKDVMAELSKQAKSEYAAERLRILSLLDRFGKYMTNLNSASDVEPAADAKPTTFIRFYQRLGNVGIWGFGDGAFQFNFPDHTKLLLYRSSKIEGHKLMLDLYHLQPDDARYLHKYGSMPDGSMDNRDSITAPVSELLGSEDANRVNVLASNEVLEKLEWIRAVVGVWMKEGGWGELER